jgi:GTP-binding protein
MATVVIAIDGPSGSGKSSTAKKIAIRSNWQYLDTGSLYRALTVFALNNSIDEEDQLISLLENCQITFNTDPSSPKIFLNGSDVSEEIRTQKVTSAVSKYSAFPKVRKHLLKIQRDYIAGAPFGIVVEGRDIATVVAPNADLKIFLDANIAARANRRESEIEASVKDSKSTKNLNVAEDLERRDLVDSSRKVSPLTQADDAIYLDTTTRTLNEVVDEIWQMLRERNLLGLPTVALIGRPNVGKSTLINRFIGRREAIVEDQPGVTRDRIRYEVEWSGRRFFILDTGGWQIKAEGIAEKISAGVDLAIKESDLIVYVVDGQQGATSEDTQLIEKVRKSNKPMILLANKIDTQIEESNAYELWNLGLGEPHFVSALHGRGSGDFLDVLIEKIPEVGAAIANDGLPRIALIGRPNVGKSSLLNSLAGANRVLVDDQAGTTRDPVDELIEFGGSTWRFVDTAGLRKRFNQDSGSDYYAALRTQLALERSEVALVLFDSTAEVTEQDLRILSLAEEAGRAIVLCMNKWDLVDEDQRLSIERQLDRLLERFTWVIRVNISAKTGWHKDRLAPALLTAKESWQRRINTAKLNGFLGEIVAANPPPVRGGKQAKIKFATQASTMPPKFVIFASEFLEGSYRKFIENRLREEFKFQSTPIEVAVKVSNTR